MYLHMPWERPAYSAHGGSMLRSAGEHTANPFDTTHGVVSHGSRSTGRGALQFCHLDASAALRWVGGGLPRSAANSGEKSMLGCWAGAFKLSHLSLGGDGQCAAVQQEGRQGCRAGMAWQRMPRVEGRKPGWGVTVGGLGWQSDVGWATFMCCCELELDLQQLKPSPAARLNSRTDAATDRPENNRQCDGAPRCCGRFMSEGGSSCCCAAAAARVSSVVLCAIVWCEQWCVLHWCAMSAAATQSGTVFDGHS
jgi:hypothetical protein